MLQNMNQKDDYFQEKVARLMKNKLGEKIMKEFATLRPKTYSYLIDDSAKNKKIKRHR